MTENVVGLCATRKARRLMCLRGKFLFAISMRFGAFQVDGDTFYSEIFCERREKYASAKPEGAKRPCSPAELA